MIIYKCKSYHVEGTLKTFQLPLLFLGSNLNIFTWPTRLSSSGFQPLTNLSSVSLPLLTKLQPPWPPLWSVGNLIPSPGVLLATVLCGMFNLQAFSWLDLGIRISLSSDFTSSEEPSLLRQIRHRPSALLSSFSITLSSSLQLLIFV